MSIYCGVVVIGGGFSGLEAAKAIAARGLGVTVVEKRELFKGTSRTPPGRMGLGFHYPQDIPTAILCLERTIEHQRAYPGFIVGREQSENHYLRRGRYFLPKTSAVTQKQLLDTCEALKARYKELVAIDKRNEVFGPPSEFYRVLEPGEYQNVVAPDTIAFGVETCEHLLRQGDFSAHVIKNLTENKGINVITNSAVVAVKQVEATTTYSRFELTLDNGDVLRTSHVVNATWENTEAINQMVGIEPPPERTIRLKILVEVILPPDLEDVNSMFILSLGYGCMFTNLGRDASGVSRGVLSYAPETNMDFTTDLVLPDRMRCLLENDLTTDRYFSSTQKILDGVAQVIPAMADAQVTGIRRGFVKTSGCVNFLDPENPVHTRRESGVTHNMVGWTTNQGMKFFNAVSNAREVAQHVWNDHMLRQPPSPILSHSKPHWEGSPWEKAPSLSFSAWGYKIFNSLTACCPKFTSEEASSSARAPKTHTKRLSQ